MGCRSSESERQLLQRAKRTNMSFWARSSPFPPPPPTICKRRLKLIWMRALVPGSTRDIMNWLKKKKQQQPCIYFCLLACPLPNKSHPPNAASVRRHRHGLVMLRSRRAVRNIQRTQNGIDSPPDPRSQLMSWRRTNVVNRSVRQVVSRLRGVNGSTAVIQWLYHASSMPSEGGRRTLVSVRDTLCVRESEKTRLFRKARYVSLSVT